MAKIAYLECSKCGEQISGAQPQTICPKDGGSLYVRFDLAALKGKFTRDSYVDALPPCGAIMTSFPVMCL